MASRASLVLACVALLVAALPAAAGAAAAPTVELELQQFTPASRNLTATSPGSPDVFLIAFVNPVTSGKSAALHPVLHALNRHYHRQRSPRVAISFADVSLHRSFVRQFALKEVPTLLAFFPQALGPACTSSPVLLQYNESHGWPEYRREVDHLAAFATGLGFSSRPGSAGGLLSAEALRSSWAAALRSVRNGTVAADVARAQAEADAAAAAAAANATAAVAAEASTPADGSAATDVAVTAAGEPAPASVNRSGNASEPTAPPAPSLHPTLAALRAEAEASLADLEVSRAQLRYTLFLLQGLQEEGPGALARLMNAKRGALFRGRGQLTAEQRDALLVELGVLLDMGAALGMPLQ